MEELANAALNWALLSIHDILTGWWLEVGREDEPEGLYRLDIPLHPRVLHHGDHLMVVDKDYGLVINHDSRTRPSVAKQLKAKYPHLADKSVEVSTFEFRICHKLYFLCLKY